jgi:hypothetical protein
LRWSWYLCIADTYVLLRSCSCYIQSEIIFISCCVEVTHTRTHARTHTIFEIKIADRNQVCILCHVSMFCRMRQFWGRWSIWNSCKIGAILIRYTSERSLFVSCANTANDTSWRMWSTVSTEGEGKSKVVTVLFIFNWAPRHEGVLGEWMYSTTHSWPRHKMDVSGQFHASAALHPGKELLVPIE